MSDPRRAIHREVPRFNRAIASVTYVLQHLFPDSVRLESMRVKNAMRVARKLKGTGRTIAVERRGDLGEKEFVREYLKKGVPVVFEGLAKDWPCTRKWNMDFLKDHCGEESFSVIDIPGLVEDEFATTRGKDKEVVLERVSARDFVLSIRRGMRSYLRACPILENKPELLQDLDLAWLKKMRRSLLGVSFQSFLGSGGRTTPIHAESCAFFFVVANGEKRWTMFSAASSAILNPAPEGHGYCFSRVKVKSPDLNKHPGFDRLSRYTCDLKAGDVLFVPSWMRHEVDTFTESWSVSYRFTYVRGFLTQPAFAFARFFLAKPPLVETLYYSFFKNDMGNRKKNLLVPRLFMKD